MFSTSTKQDRKNARRSHLILLILGSCAVFLSLLSLFHRPPESVWEKVLLAGLAELGFAIIIAIIVGNLIDIKAHEKIEEKQKEYDEKNRIREEKYQEDIKDREFILSNNIIEYIYSTKLPRRVFNFVESQIFQQNLYKKDLKVEYDFCEFSENSVLIRNIFEYEVENISENTKDFTIPFYLDKSLGVIDSNFTKNEGPYQIFIGEEVPPADFKCIDDELQDTDTHKKYGYPVKLEPGETLPVRICVYIIKRIADAELWMNMYLADGVNLTIRYPKDKLELTVEPVHARNKFERETQEDFGIYAVIKGPILPSDGINIRWHPKTSPSKRSEKTRKA